MRRAMAAARVGDDVYGEDPTVNRLQERAADIFGKQAALFVPTGTMGNQIAVKLHTSPGEEVIIEERGHMFNYEMAMMAAFSGVLARPVAGRRGILDWEAIEKAIHPEIYYYARTGLITLENSHNMAGGTVYSCVQGEAVCGQAQARGIPVHLDGARIFNAAVALETSVRSLCEPFDTVMFCLSKGLCAPVGSMLLGSKDAIEEARKLRKMLGGGMRQAGVLAAAGLIALEEMPQRLHEDHETARRLARGLAAIAGLSVDPEAVQTNIVILDIEPVAATAEKILARLKERGILMGWVGPQTIRAVTHADVSLQDIELVLAATREILGK
ncbi:MAG: aminotransferase class I/II-fold pyridoxal phosphate-dependent enzyme [Acidobacteria bacterium]|nr:aminotransferase class I/II-fold pyridoxal phosphate-dependent enzyme [Acidobacteriota bacterium]